MFQTRPLPGGLGMEILDFSGASTRDPEALKAFRELLREHWLVKTNVEDFGESEQRRLAEAIGEITIRGSYDVDPDTPDMQYVSNTRGDGILGRGRLGYHHDHLFYEQPLTALMLYGIEVPESGSVTGFRSCADQLRILSPELREAVQDVECLHMYDYTKIHAGRYKPWDDPDDASPEAESDYKPFIWEQPGSGVKVLWHSPSTISFRGIEREAGIALYGEIDDYLAEHTAEIAGYEHHWRTGDLLVWDNLMVCHARMPFDNSEPRTLRRTPII